MALAEEGEVLGLLFGAVEETGGLEVCERGDRGEKERERKEVERQLSPGRNPARLIPSFQTSSALLSLLTLIPQPSSWTCRSLNPPSRSVMLMCVDPMGRGREGRRREEEEEKRERTKNIERWRDRGTIIEFIAAKTFLPASRLFSSSSFRADTGLCTISPAAILLTRSAGRR